MPECSLQNIRVFDVILSYVYVYPCVSAPLVHVILSWIHSSFAWQLCYISADFK